MRNICTVLITLFCLLACSLSAFAAEKVTLRAGGGAIMSGMPLWANDYNGEYKKHGLDVQYKIFPSGTAALEGFSAKQFDVATASSIPAVLAGARINSIIIGIACEENDSNATYVRPDSPLLKTKGAMPGYPEIYGTPDDWRGKKVLCTTLSGGHYALLATLNALGLQEKDINLIQIDQGQALTAFSANQADLAQLWAPSSYVGQNKGWKRVSSGKRAKVNIPGCILVNRDFAEKNPETVVVWLDLYLRIVEAMKADRKFASDLLHSFFTGHCNMDMPWALVDIDYEHREYLNLAEQLEALTNPQKMRHWMEETAKFLAAARRINEKEFEKFKALGCTIEPKFMKMVAEKRAREAAAAKTK